MLGMDDGLGSEVRRQLPAPLIFSRSALPQLIELVGSQVLCRFDASRFGR